MSERELITRVVVIRMILERKDDDFVIVRREVVSEREWPTTDPEARLLEPS